MKRFVLFAFVLVLLTACSATASVTEDPVIPTSLPAAEEGVELTVSTAANLTDAMNEMVVVFEEETGIAVTVNFGSSGQLAQQIEAGAPVDVFLSANTAYVDELDEKGLIISDSNATYALGRITLWTQSDSSLNIEQISDLALDEVTSIAIANPESAPYGVAAREALQAAGIWEAVESKVVMAETIQQTLQYAETGNVDVGIVALSLSIHSEGNWVLVPDDLHEPIAQALGIIAGTSHEQEARLFTEFVLGPEGTAILEEYGYSVP